MVMKCAFWTSGGRTLVLLTCMLMLSACSNNPKKQNDDVFSIVDQADRAYQESRWLQASQLYKQVTELVPDDHYAWFRLGNTEIRQGRIDSAIYSYKEALTRNTSHAKTHYNLSLAYILYALSQMEQAQNSLRDEDPAKRSVQSKIRQLQKFVDQPIEYSNSPLGYHFPRYGRVD